MKHGGIAEILATGKCPGIVGTQTNFKTPFKDKGKVIDTWSKWDKAGFRPLDISKDIRSDKVREGVAKKIWKINRQGKRKPLTTELM